MEKTRILCILDGFGMTHHTENNAIAQANIPVIRSLLAKNPWITLDSDGSAVGQEKGLVGNSEVGHMNIGGMKLVPQLSYQITESSMSAFDNFRQYKDQNHAPKTLISKTFEQGKNKTVHLIGLFSKGTIHSDLRHWIGAIESAGNAGAESIVLHIISDGRDSDPQSLSETWDYFVDTFRERLEPYQGRMLLGSLGGRFFGMDRDSNYSRTATAMVALLDSPIPEHLGEDTSAVVNALNELNQSGETFDRGTAIIELDNEYVTLDIIASQLNYSKTQYDAGKTDETLCPITFGFRYTSDKKNKKLQSIRTNIVNQDVVWLINFRTDRMKQTARLLNEINIAYQLNLSILAMNDYGIGFLNDSKEVSSLKSSNSILPKFDHITTESQEHVKEANSNGYTPLFQHRPVEQTLSDQISNQRSTQLHIAETEKYSHVTYFFNGGRNKKNKGEDWVIIDSNKVKSHAQKPEMKAKEITDYIIDSLHAQFMIRPIGFDDEAGYINDIKEYWNEIVLRWYDSPPVSGDDLNSTIHHVYQGSGSLKNAIEKGWAYYIFDNNDNKIGLIQIHVDSDSDEMQIFDLAIFKEYRNKGYGSEVLKYIKSKASLLGCRRIKLWADQANKDAIRFYERHGFGIQSYKQFDWYDSDGQTIYKANAHEMHYTTQEKSSPLHPMKYDYVIVNYANPDMVGHTGDFDACVQSLEYLDTQLGRLLDATMNDLCTLIVISDHGNAERVGHIHGGGVDTRHNDNPVPCIFVSNNDLVESISNNIKATDLVNQEIKTRIIDSLELAQPQPLQDHEWLTEDQIPAPTLPLWVAGLFLFIQ